ncbi:UBX domain-containing protein 11 Socius UBX domain-containing protein 5 [Channa argus]|uniref:UBX domain-containing protein 11 Socius UBX domain-containing protein 5 n=1 Tax=Channa argus TaxID=215402 RepID=A0A6G1PNI1_CHAAH|nr:UBX domain-containing protein 11 Socius UBX domain-containing protein 5 [Channa argus]
MAAAGWRVAIASRTLNYTLTKAPDGESKMSSPLSMLKKTRRTPLHGLLNDQGGRQKVSFRRNLLKEFQAALVDDGDSSNPDIPIPAHAPASGPPSDFELMSAMMQQLTLLERQVKIQAQEIKHKSFLNDYGLIWVGDGQSSDSNDVEQPAHNLERGLWQPGTSVVRNFRMNFDLVLQRIRELNILAGEGESFIQTTATGAQLKIKDPIQLRLYRNGIVMFDGPFRSYQEHSTQVHDRRDEEFIISVSWDTFPGEGQAVQKRSNDSSNVASLQIPVKKLTMHQFLNRLPKVVVKAGRVIDIRDSLQATLQGSSEAQSSDSVILIDTPALQAMKEKLLTSVRPLSVPEVFTLKVKSEDGKNTYVLKMCFSETIGHVRQYLDKQRGGGQLEYDIISAYPKCCYNDDCQILQSCGLTTNTLLLLRKRQQPHSQT